MSEINEPTPEETAAVAEGEEEPEVEAHGVRDLQGLPSDQAGAVDAPAHSTLSLTVCS
jgi:hypothetical protein